LGNWWSHDVLDDWLLGSCSGGGNLSGSWLDWNNLWTHVLVLKNGLALHALVDAEEVESHLDGEANGAPDGATDDDGVPELLGLHLSLLLGHVWKFIQPGLVWILMFLMVGFLGSFIIFTTLMAVMHTTVLTVLAFLTLLATMVASSVMVEELLVEWSTGHLELFIITFLIIETKVSSEIRWWSESILM
jgi:hypothetical protein